MQDPELTRLQRALAAHRRDGGLRYPPALRAQISAWVAAQRAGGAWWCDVARLIGIPESTLVRWSTVSGVGAAPIALRPVVVVDAPALGTVTLVAPSGLRIEGVSVDAAIAILRGLT